MVLTDEERKERRKEIMRKYRENNKEKINQQRKEYREKTKEERSIAWKIYYKENKNYLNDKKKKHQEDNKEYYQEYNKDYYKNNKAYFKKADWKQQGIKGDLDKIYNYFITCNKCEVCKIVFKDTFDFDKCLDHNHKTGEFRYVLCRNCNSNDNWKKLMEIS